jgi:hypothetical protein
MKEPAWVMSKILVLSEGCILKSNRLGFFHNEP